MIDYSEIASTYARDVMSGAIPACNWVRLAAKRHLDDLVKSEQADYPYEFCRAKADRICAFIEKLPHVKGRWAARRERLKLQPWQIFTCCCLFGWLHKDSKLRRFRHPVVDLQIACLIL
jgi:phage terminase large subunit-like protein